MVIHEIMKASFHSTIVFKDKSFCLKIKCFNQKKYIIKNQNIEFEKKITLKQSPYATITPFEHS